MGYYEYNTKIGKTKGFFTIFQLNNGAIELVIGKNGITLSLEQINNLGIDCYELVNFNHDNFLNFYKKQ
jgi:hypothetical protein